jgi:hypothetical protein
MKLLVVGGLLATCTTAQVFTEPPPIVQLVRIPRAKDVWTRQYKTAQARVEVLGMTAITGLPETWLVEAHDSFASVEDLDRRLASLPQGSNEFSPPSTMIGVLRPNWSYRPDQASRMFVKARYFQISIHQVRAGMEADYAELVRLRRLGQDTMNLDRPEIAYQVIAGAPAGTFVFLAPLLSLKSLDEGRPDVPVYAENLAAERAKARAKVAPDAELLRENQFLRVEPRLSYVSDEFASGDTAFWRQ